MQPESAWPNKNSIFKLIHTYLPGLQVNKFIPKLCEVCLNALQISNPILQTPVSSVVDDPYKKKNLGCKSESENSIKTFGFSWRLKSGYSFSRSIESVGD